MTLKPTQGKYLDAQCYTVSIMTVQLTQNLLPQGISLPLSSSRKEASQLKVPEAHSPGPSGSATGGAPTFVSAPKPSPCSLGLTSSAPLGVPLTQKGRFLGQGAVLHASSLRWLSSREDRGIIY